MNIPENVADLLSWEKKSFAHLALVLRDGTPQCTPLWFDYDGTHVIINSALGRVKVGFFDPVTPLTPLPSLILALTP